MTYLETLLDTIESLELELMEETDFDRCEMLNNEINELLEELNEIMTGLIMSEHEEMGLIKNGQLAFIAPFASKYDEYVKLGDTYIHESVFADVDEE